MKKSLMLTSVLVMSLIACNSNSTSEENTIAFEETIPLREVKSSEFFIEQIKSDSSWFYLVGQKAKQQNLSVDEVLAMDAEYLVNRDAAVVKIENDIIKNKEWVEAVKMKAKEQNVELDLMIRADAEYMFDQQNQAPNE